MAPIGAGERQMAFELASELHHPEIPDVLLPREVQAMMRIHGQCHDAECALAPFKRRDRSFLFRGELVGPDLASADQVHRGSVRRPPEIAGRELGAD